ncbi:TetR/AcrR family transcriptional regulator [Sinorhizobium mexicanum]|uniref:TetR/AcrR family transcriptional regulator n=1 Tax=Sinorhizobium mexicanum TaxID=375549 RepID=A0A859QJS1_9HYPH|nr:TetR/AcrR family transcriptional regulator [Sinorhizobium mexicanum]MBP1881770.1 AcrR family transcriptional regulator [Sinorhizobium mexicanum]QLL61527.1 TetR/AcrR family transcriptional regulator [Sinorhizobium mexicanum]
MDMDAPQESSKPNIRGRIKQQKTELIQEEILDAAARLIAARGFRAVTVDDISAEMGFTKSIVYYYMKNKNEILWRIFEKIDHTYAKGLEEALSSGGTPTELLAKIVKMHSLNVMEHQDWSTIYNRDENELTEEQRAAVTSNRRKYNKQIQDLYSQGIASKEFRETDPFLAVCCVIGACNWPYTWFRRSSKYSAEDVASAFADQLIKGVARGA